MTNEEIKIKYYDGNVDFFPFIFLGICPFLGRGGWQIGAGGRPQVVLIFISKIKNNNKLILILSNLCLLIRNFLYS